MKLRQLLAVAALVVFASPAMAQDRSSAPLEHAKRYFRAGASAYQMGDYLAAIQALEAAYRLTPLPGIAFSLAQAERRQYFVSRDRAHLDRAVELYQRYLREVPVGGRRADATDALAQLEPLAAVGPTPRDAASAGTDGALTADSLPVPLPGSSPRGPDGQKTRLMISSSAPNARVEIEGRGAAPAPLIAEVTPGMHRIKVRAPGYFDAEREVEAIAGELLPVEVAQLERPASLHVRVRPEAELHVGDAYAGRVDGARTLSLPSGVHVLSFARNGYELYRVHTALEPGASREVTANLEPTAQRTASLTLFVVGGAALATGAVLSGFALEREDAARSIEGRRERAEISPREQADYDDALRDRDRFRIAAGVSFGVALASAVTGLFLFALDQPDLREPGFARGMQAGVRF